MTRFKLYFIHISSLERSIMLGKVREKGERRGEGERVREGTGDRSTAEQRKPAAR